MRYLTCFAAGLLFAMHAVVASAQDFDITDIVTAQTAYDEGQSRVTRAALLAALSAYRGDATIETVNAHLIVMSNDVLANDFGRLRESTDAAAAHLQAVSDIVPKQYADSKFLAATSLFNGRKSSDAILEMAHVEGFTRNVRDDSGERPDWATAMMWKAQAWGMAMEAYFKSVRKDYPDADTVDAIVQGYDTGRAISTTHEDQAISEEKLPHCPGSMRQTPKLRYPIDNVKGSVGAVILGLEFDSDGQVINPKVLASIPVDEFDEKSLRVVDKWTFKPDNPKDVGVSCRLERTNVVQPLIFFTQ